MADTPYQGFIGATYGGDARHLSAEQCINLYPEPTGAPGTTPKRPLALRHTPGLKAFGTAGSGPVRGVFYDPGVERLFCVSGGEFYELGEGGAATKIGDVATGILPVTWASNGVGGQQIMLTSGGRGYIFDLRDDTFTPITAEHFPQNVIACAYIQTYFLVLPANSRRLRRPARRRPVGPRPRCANLRRTLASGRAPAMRQMGTVLGRQPNPAAAARLGRRRGMLRRGPGRGATARVRDGRVVVNRAAAEFQQHTGRPPVMAAPSLSVVGGLFPQKRVNPAVFLRLNRHGLLGETIA